MAETPCIALKKMFGKEWRHGWWVGSITLSETMAYWKNCWVWHTLQEDKDKKQVNKDKFKAGRTVGSGTPCPACSAPRGCPGCSRTWQNVFFCNEGQNLFSTWNSLEPRTLWSSTLAPAPGLPWAAALQATFLRTWTSADELTRPGSPWSWDLEWLITRFDHYLFHWVTSPVLCLQFIHIS